MIPFRVDESEVLVVSTLLFFALGFLFFHNLFYPSVLSCEVYIFQKGVVVHVLNKIEVKKSKSSH